MGVDMSSQNTISMASSRQFERIQQQTRIAVPSEQLIPTAADNIEPDLSRFDEVTVTLSAEQSIQVNLLNKLYGKQVVLPDLVKAAQASPEPVTTEESTLPNEPITVSSGEPLSFVLAQNYFYESESTSFSASGNMTLSDGSNISFDFAMNYTREFESYSEQLFLQQELKDPLVINLSNEPISLSDRTASFDLDADGVLDEIPTLSAGSAFLAIDKNNNGKIDDGTELFGSQTGNGFFELAEYDSNQDGFINQHDDVFNQLLIWQPGNSNKLTNLSDTDVDTLSLQAVSTEFQFTNEKNQLLGQMRQSSVYAKEDGSVGSLHQVDLVI